MHNPLRLHVPSKPQSSRYLASIQSFGGILRWLVGLIWLTEEEKKDAGIYFGNQMR